MFKRIAVAINLLSDIVKFLIIVRERSKNDKQGISQSAFVPERHHQAL